MSQSIQPSVLPISSVQKKTPTIIGDLTNGLKSLILNVYFPHLINFLRDDKKVVVTTEELCSVFSIKSTSSALPNGMPLPGVFHGTGAAPQPSRKSGGRKKKATDARKCIYTFTRGKKKNQRCDKSCVAGETMIMCTTHCATTTGKKQWKQYISKTNGASTSAMPAGPTPANQVSSIPPPVSETTSSLEANPDSSDGILVSIPDNFKIVQDPSGNYKVTGVRPVFGDPSKDRPCTASEAAIAQKLGLAVAVGSPVGPESSALPGIPGIPGITNGTK